MSVGLLLVTHNAVGAELLAAATAVLGRCPLQAEALGIGPDDERDRMTDLAAVMAARLDRGDGLLVLTDLYGSTPANIAGSLSQKHRTRILTGVNLAMLVRVLNYARLGLDELADKALSGGRDAVMLSPEPETRDPARPKN